MLNPMGTPDQEYPKMRVRVRAIRPVLLAMAGLFAVAGNVRADTYNFGDEYYLNSGASFSSVFTGATGTASSKGIYQETQDATHGGIIITKLATSGAPGEFLQNTSPNASTG